MTRTSADFSPPDTLAEPPAPDEGGSGASPRLQGLDTNPESQSGPRFWQGFREAVAHIYTLSLPDPSEEARFTLASRTYPTPRAILVHSRGTAFVMTRGPLQAARSPDQLLIYLQLEGSCDNDWAGRRGRVEPGDVQIVDYALPFHSVTTDYANLIVALARESAPAALLAVQPHGQVFRRGSGAARLIGAAMLEFFAQADDLAVSEAEAAIEGIVALTTACARARLASDEANHVKSRRKAVLDYVDMHLANAQLGPSEIAQAVHLSRSSLYRLLAAEGGIRALLLRRRLEQALRLLLADVRDEYALADVAGRCGFAGTSQFSRAFRMRFGLPPQQYRALVRQQDRDWFDARLREDGFGDEPSSWRYPGLPVSQQSGVPD